ncbi:MAG: hypothetical protein E3J56_04330 [Candidatus Aminicenantes bacterium]|nr:MAG: hypothetical protein E3J56_04330 [Candidatus Aminicenantes bacterium]
MANVRIHARKHRSREFPIIPDHQIDKIQKARNEAFIMVKKGLKDLDNIWNQSSRKRTRVRRRRDIRKKRKKAWIDNKNVRVWFGRGHLNTLQIKWTRERLIRIKEEFEGTLRFTIIQHQEGYLSFRCDSKIIAYCSPGTPIKLCPDWFKKGQKERAVTVVHELSHKNGHIHRRGFKKVKDVINFAKNHPRLARRNPYNFEQFCGEYYERKR